MSLFERIILYIVYTIQTTETQSTYFQINKMTNVCLCVDFCALDANTSQVSHLVIPLYSDRLIFPKSASSKWEE